MMNLKFKDFDEFMKKYPVWEEWRWGVPEVIGMARVGRFFDVLGILLHRRLIDIEMVDELFGGYIKTMWEKISLL
jgi:hypothetical protein